ncbi:MAG TPA: sigma 54-interacting transcriptional regulator, partial [Bacteroidia bacterium]|nr:sigma 54-interacting transcriptional regulator [Bacteroidia bacterium]
ELANGGTLFLDEIGNLSYDNQIKLLRVLQERKIRPIGDVKDIDVDIRIIVATNEDIRNSIKGGSFREDIYYRINEFTIELPSLRERKEDLVLYARHFLALANHDLNKSVEGFTPEVMTKFHNYNWPGNLREMKNVVKRAALLSQQGQMIGISELPVDMLNPQVLDDTSDEADSNEIIDLKTVAERAERKAILNALVKTGYNKSRTAEMLKVDRKTLYNKMTALGIDPKY